jgi:AcrR family transcriptional regulator
MDTREQILDATLRLFAELGRRGATTRRIAEAAGVNEVTLFRQFGSKEALLREALARAGGAMEVARLPAEPVDPREELTTWCRRHLRGLYAARALLRTSMAEVEERPEAGAVACEVPLRASAELEAYLARLRETGRAEAALEPRAAAAMLMGAIFSDALSRDMMPGRFAETLDAAAAEYVDLLLRAIGAGEIVTARDAG